jgi:hypothetical protein
VVVDSLRAGVGWSPGDAAPPLERSESEEDEAVDETMLTRTLQQLARRERTLASLRVQCVFARPYTTNNTRSFARRIAAPTYHDTAAPRGRASASPCS